MSEHVKNEHKHGTSGMTSWVHHHRRLAKWLVRLLVAGVTTVLYYLKTQEKVIEWEAKHDK